ncbi:serine/threonine-protein kinase [Isosphaeraceae bacterium EP7]
MSHDASRDDPTLDVGWHDASDDPFDALAEDFARRCRRGEVASISDDAERHPEFADRIRKLFPAIAKLEQLGRTDRSNSPRGPLAAPPTRLGEFRIVGELGRGGMGVVYEAVQESLGRHVALKVLHYGLVDPKRLGRFRREAQAVARLHHTNIVPIFGVGDHEGFPYYAMQHIRGRGLDALLASWRADGPPPISDRAEYAAGIIAQAALALHYAHEQGVLHRDVKPANLLVDKHDAVWLTDFGLAKMTGEDDLTNTGDVIGTLRYLAPEALRGESGPRSDVYSLGLTLYELLTLSPPFGIELSASELLRQVSEGQPLAPRRLDAGISRDLETIVLKSIAREPGHRYQTARAMADDLARYLEDRPILARRATPLEKVWRWGRRNRAVAALSAAAVGSLLLAAIVGWAGYVTTTKALLGESTKKEEAQRATRRADENVTLSLQVFGELFDKLSPHVDFLPPPTGRVRPPGGRGPRDGFAPRSDEFGPPFERGMGPPGSGMDRPPLPPSGHRPIEIGRGRPEAHGEGGPRGGSRTSARDAELLESILSFYDRFARQNSTNPKLQFEAARAYFRVGVIREAMGKEDESLAAYGLAIGRFEELVARYPEEPQYRAELVKLFIMADPWTADEAGLEPMVIRLRRAGELLDRGDSRAENSETLRSRVHVDAKLAAALHRLGRLDEAEAADRRAIEAADRLLALSPGDFRGQLDRADVREELCRLRMERGETEDARGMLAATRADLMAAAMGYPSAPPIADRIRSLAQLHVDLGESDQAEALLKLIRDRRDEVGPHERGPAMRGRPRQGGPPQGP